MYRIIEKKPDNTDAYVTKYFLQKKGLFGWKNIKARYDRFWGINIYASLETTSKKRALKWLEQAKNGTLKTDFLTRTTKKYIY